jgi:hypothetical protein
MSELILQSEPHRVRCSFLGLRRWRVVAEGVHGGGPIEASNDTVVATVLDALHLSLPVQYNSRRIEASLGDLRGWVRNHTFPKNLWMYNTPNAMGQGTLAECVWSLLCEFHLPSMGSPPMLQPLVLSRFTHEAFSSASEPEPFRAALEKALNEYIGQFDTQDETRKALSRVLAALQAHGHVLYLFDSDHDSFEIWCGDWAKPKGRRDLSLHFYRGEYEPMRVTVGW